MKCPIEYYEKWFSLGAKEKAVGEFFEFIIEEFYTKFLTEGNAIDCGANKGRHTYPLANILKPNRWVLAIEAIPSLASKLVSDSESAGIKNLIIEAAAISNEVGVSEFIYVKNSDGYSGLKERPDLPSGAEKSVEKIMVQKKLLDQIVEEINFVDIRFLKLDLEGGEYNAIRGAEKILNKYNPILIMENGGNESAKLYGYQLSDWFYFFEKNNYKIYDLFGREYNIDNYRSYNRPWYLICAKLDSDINFIDNNIIEIIENAERKYYDKFY